ncbi:Cyclin PHO80-like protein [Aduncisulcus paluster]|uniref:Cyclin PHO80-like protein n=1 Tax=Aduncisulcus paluster TaxID=2918883 RepID=A0ABQ5JVF7_9EUKA|nr:Cyclin PHO80-like protein [Aduncisulcus paluster]
MPNTVELSEDKWVMGSSGEKHGDLPSSEEFKSTHHKVSPRQKTVPFTIEEDLSVETNEKSLKGEKQEECESDESEESSSSSSDTCQDNSIIIEEPHITLPSLPTLSEGAALPQASQSNPHPKQGGKKWSECCPYVEGLVSTLSIEGFAEYIASIIRVILTPCKKIVKFTGKRLPEPPMYLRDWILRLLEKSQIPRPVAIFGTILILRIHRRGFDITRNNAYRMILTAFDVASKQCSDQPPSLAMWSNASSYFGKATISMFETEFLCIIQWETFIKEDEWYNFVYDTLSLHPKAKNIPDSIPKAWADKIWKERDKKK